MEWSGLPQMCAKAAQVCAVTLCALFLFVNPARAEEKAPAPAVVELTATDGTKLAATYFAAAQPGPGVLLLHQCNQQRKTWDGLAGELAAQGIHVLTLDYRGYGDSKGIPATELKMENWKHDFLDKLPGDVDVALEYLESQPGVTRHIIGIGGASCSVNQTVQAAKRHPEVRSLVLLSGSTDRSGRVFLESADKLPVLLVGSKDDGESVPMMQWLYSLSKNPGSRFIPYDTGGHGTEMFAAHKGLPGTIVDWFVQTLEKTPGSAPPTPGERPSSAFAPSVYEVIDTGGANKVEAKLRAARKTDPNAKLFDENVVNVVGYEHMQNGDNQGALEILRLNAFAFPHSANVWDSLADAYLMAGDKKLARRYTEKAAQMLETDTTASESMRKMVKESIDKKMKELSEDDGKDQDKEKQKDKDKERKG